MLPVRLPGRFVIVPEQVEQPVDEQVVQVILRPDPRFQGFADLGGQLVVDPAEDLIGPLELPGHAAQKSDGDGHEKRRRNALAGHVPNGDNDAILGGAQNLVQVAAHFLGGLLSSGPIQV